MPRARNKRVRVKKLTRNEHRFGVTKMPFVRRRHIPKAKNRRGLTRIQLLSNVPEVITRTSEHVTFTAKRKVRMRKSKRIKIQTRTLTSIPGESPREHRQEVLILQPGKLDPLEKGVKLRVSCDCVTGDTRVLTDEGYKTVYSLIDHQSDPSKDFPINYVVNDEVRKGSVPFHKGIQPVWKITLSNGHSFEATREHKILLYKGKDFKARYKRKAKATKHYRWTKVENLKIKDSVAIHTSNIERTRRDTKYWNSYLAGVFYGDGTWNPPSITIASHKEIKDILANECGIAWSESGKGRILIEYKAQEILYKLGFCKDDRHYIPLDSEHLNIYGFISGLIDADGHINKWGQCTIVGTEQLRPLAERLTELGVPGIKFNLYREEGTHVSGDYVATKDSYSIGLKPQAIYSIGKNLESLKYHNWVENSDKEPRRHTNTASIESIEYAGQKHVYDITVPGAKRFVAESAIVHNCEWHMYVCEVALNKYGASPIRYSNGAYPKYTNPSGIPIVCKHIHTLLTRKSL